MMEGGYMMYSVLSGDNLLTSVSVSRECGILPRESPLAFVTVNLDNDKPFIKLKPLSLSATSEVVSASKQ